MCAPEVACDHAERGMLTTRLVVAVVCSVKQSRRARSAVSEQYRSLCRPNCCLALGQFEFDNSASEQFYTDSSS
jgi:hypothetical protein